jgi:hypothetical protein
VLSAVEPDPGSPLTPSPYAPVLFELIDASCIWITSSRSPAAIGVAAPLGAPTASVV